MIKNSLEQFISLTEICFDSIIWFKIEKRIVKSETDIVGAFVYFPPQYSSFYNLYDCDLFYEFENEVAHYLTLGSIFVIGYFNSRIRSHDFIQIDVLHQSVSNIIDSIFTYANDTTMKSRVNPDTGHNEYGTRLLQLCKATGLRIVNGRHKDGDSNSYTYSGPRGSSVID